MNQIIGVTVKDELLAAPTSVTSQPSNQFEK